MGDTTVKSESKPVIYLTGFGPFGPYKRNSSEAAVTLLSQSSLSEELGVNLITEVLDVNYNKTQTHVPQQWQKYKPALVVHVGVSGQAQHLTLEQSAHNAGYCMLDNAGACPEQLCCMQGAPAVLHTTLPLPTICSELNSRPHLKLRCILSQDAGRFLCSYVYYTSLLQDARRSVFVHVPPLETFSVEDTAACLSAAVTLLYRAVTAQSGGLGEWRKEPSSVDGAESEDVVKEDVVEGETCKEVCTLPSVVDEGTDRTVVLDDEGNGVDGSSQQGGECTLGDCDESGATKS